MFNFLKRKPKEVKFCKDCKYYDNGSCLNKNARDEEIDLVTGKMIPGISYCSVAREYSCGKEAKYFEAKDNDK
jgi:hypothetical protein